MNQFKYIYTFAFLISFSCFSQVRKEFVIKFKSNINQEQMISHMRQLPNISDWRFIASNPTHPLSHIVKFSSASSSIEQWNINAHIDYIEQIPETFFSTDTLPSDPYFPFQWENAFTHVQSAWALLEPNDKNLLVGIVDSGTDFEHEDLQNYYIKPSEPINGLDDDGNGLIDDFRGWDFGEYDNNPSVFVDNPHGRQMTSLVAAETNNGIGMSAFSYNVKYITAKISADNGEIPDPFEGIMYVVDEGAKVVNCSWYQNISTKYAKDIIDYAISKNAIVVASAGNGNSNTPVYPASYENVIGVGAIDHTGDKTNVSNYGDWVDIYAPGIDIYVAYPNDTYFTTGGTSTSSALVASACCLLKKIFPEETPLQLLSRIKRTGTDLTSPNISGKYLNLKQAIKEQFITEFKIFPNPSSNGNVSIDLPFVTDQSTVRLSVHNLLGQNVYNKLFTLHTGEKTLNTTFNFDNGQYIISVEAENIRKTTKFTLAR